MGLCIKSKYLKLGLKIIIILSAWSFVAYKIINTSELNSFSNYFSTEKNHKILIILLLLILMLLNWTIEAIKWRNLIIKLEKKSIFESLKAVWTGVTIGTLTPNRIGEFGGRILFVKKENRIQATAMTLYGDLSQFIITFVIGLFGFIVLMNLHYFSDKIKSFDTIIIILGFISILASGVIYFKINTISQFLGKFKLTSKIFKKALLIQNISSKIKLNTLILSGLRYLIFTFQFYMAFYIFDINISYSNAILAISSIYLASSIIPNIPFAEIGIRLSFSIIFIGIFTNDYSAIILASLLIYLINLVLPTIFGGGILLIHDKSQEK